MSKILVRLPDDLSGPADDEDMLSRKRISRYPRAEAVTTEHINAVLRELVEPAEGKRWLSTPQEVFGGRTPEDLMSNGEARRVYQVLVRLEEGIHV